MTAQQAQQLREMLGQQQQARPYEILINGVDTEIGHKLPSVIEYLNISINPMIQQTVRPHNIKLVKNWLNAVVDALTNDYATLNGLAIRKEDINIFKL